MSTRMAEFSAAVLAVAPWSLRQAWGESQFACSQMWFALQQLLAVPRRSHTTALRGLLRTLLLPSSLCLPLSAATVDLAALGTALRHDGVQGFTEDDDGDAAAAKSGAAGQDEFGVFVGRVSPRRSYVVDVDAERGAVRAIVGFTRGASALCLSAPPSVVHTTWAHSYLANIINAVWQSPSSAGRPNAWLPRYDVAAVAVRDRGTTTEVCVCVCVCVCVRVCV